MDQLSIETPEKLLAVNEVLSNQNYINGDFPGSDDVRIFDSFKSLPDKTLYPDIHFWYLIIMTFAPGIRAQWAGIHQRQQEEKKESNKPQEPGQKVVCTEPKTVEEGKAVN